MKFDKIINHIREINEKNRAEMMTIPRKINPANFAECVDVILKFFNSIMRAHLVVEMCEIAESLEIPPRDKAQLTYLKETIKENILGLYKAVSLIIDGILKNYSPESFEYKAFDELKGNIEQLVSKYLPQETEKNVVEEIKSA